MGDGVREEHSGEECGDVVVPVHDVLLGSVLSESKQKSRSNQTRCTANCESAADSELRARVLRKIFTSPIPAPRRRVLLRGLSEANPSADRSVSSRRGFWASRWCTKAM